MGSRPVICLWLWPATDHEPHCWLVPINKIWRRTESTPQSRWWRSHMAGIYNDCSTCEIIISNTHTHTLTHPFNGPLSGWASTRKVTPMWILLKQETMSGSAISWTICKSAPWSRQITTSAPHHSVFLQARCPSWCSANSIKALKA